MEATIKRGRGRPKGSKNKNTIAREQAQITVLKKALAEQDTKPKAKRGRKSQEELPPTYIYSSSKCDCVQKVQVPNAAFTCGKHHNHLEIVKKGK